MTRVFVCERLAQRPERARGRGGVPFYALPDWRIKSSRTVHPLGGKENDW